MNKVEQSQEDYEELSIWDLNSIINYIKDNYIQFLLLILVFFIIYIVDYISNINAMIFSMPSPIPGSKPPDSTQIKLPKKRRQSKK